MHPGLQLALHQLLPQEHHQVQVCPVCLDSPPLHDLQRAGLQRPLLPALAEQVMQAAGLAAAVPGVGMWRGLPWLP